MNQLIECNTLLCAGCENIGGIWLGALVFRLSVAHSFQRNEVEFVRPGNFVRDYIGEQWQVLTNSTDKTSSSSKQLCQQTASEHPRSNMMLS